MKFLSHKPNFMNKKIVTGAIIAIAAGLATFFYRRRKNRLSIAASDTYDTMSDAFKSTEKKVEDYF